MKAADINSICELDLRLFNDDRSFFLKHRFELNPEMCFVIEDNNLLTGYLRGQPGLGVLTIGPWAANSSKADAESLLEHFGYKFENKNYRIGVLESNLKSVELLKSFNTLGEKEPSWRMFLGSSDSLGCNDSLFAIGSPSKG